MFDLATGCSSTGQPPLRVYPVEVDEEGEIVVHLDRVARPGAEAVGRTDATSTGVESLPR